MTFVRMCFFGVAMPVPMLLALMLFIFASFFCSSCGLYNPGYIYVYPSEQAPLPSGSKEELLVSDYQQSVADVVISFHEWNDWSFFKPLIVLKNVKPNKHSFSAAMEAITSKKGEIVVIFSKGLLHRETLMEKAEEIIKILILNGCKGVVIFQLAVNNPMPKIGSPTLLERDL